MILPRNCDANSVPNGRIFLFYILIPFQRLVEEFDLNFAAFLKHKCSFYRAIELEPDGSVV